MITLTPNQLIGLHVASTESRGRLGCDRPGCKALVSRGLAHWDSPAEDECFIADAGRAIISGKTAFLLRGQSTNSHANEEAQQIAAAIRNPEAA